MKNYNHDILNVYTDGASRKNPGLGAWAFIIKDEKGKKIENGGDALRYTTNNLAEYRAIYEAIDRARTLKARVMNINSDSSLVINQLKGAYKTESPALKAMLSQIKKLMNQTKTTVNFNWISREENKEADELCNTLMDNYSKRGIK